MRDRIFEFQVIDGFAAIMYIIAVLFMIGSLFRYPKAVFTIFIGVVAVHIGMTIFTFIYSMSNSADAVRYYAYGFNPEHTIKFGISTSFIRYITYPFGVIFGFSFGGTTLFYSLISLYGHYLLLRFVADQFVKRKLTKLKYWLLLIPMLSPSLHFFTSSIGKDSLIFFALVLFVISAINKKYVQLIFAIILIGLVRPHILLCTMAGYGIALIFFNKKVPLGMKIGVIVLGIGVIAAVLPTLMKKLYIDDLSNIDEVVNTAEKYSTYNQDGGSSVDLADANLVVKIISYLFRPFFIDAHNAMALFSSFDNIIWVITIGYLFFNYRLFIKQKLFKSELLSLLLPFILILVILSFTLNNLGIAVRQKTMLFPFLILMLVYVMIKKHYMTLRIKNRIVWKT